MAKKPYKAKSITGAQQRVRELLKQRADCERYMGRMHHEITLLARLAADGPAFFNPLEAMAAKKIRDRELQHMNMNPDGTFIKGSPPQRESNG